MTALQQHLAAFGFAFSASSFNVGDLARASVDDGNRRRAPISGVESRVDVTTAGDLGAAVDLALGNLTSSGGNGVFLASLAASGGPLAGVNRVEKSAVPTTESGSSSDSSLGSAAIAAVAVVGAVLLLVAVALVLVQQRRKSGRPGPAARKGSRSEAEPIYSSASVLGDDADVSFSALDETAMTTATDDEEALVQLRAAARGSTSQAWGSEGLDDGDRVVFHNPVGLDGKEKERGARERAVGSRLRESRKGKKRCRCVCSGVSSAAFSDCVICFILHDQLYAPEENGGDSGGDDISLASHPDEAGYLPIVG